MKPMTEVSSRLSRRRLAAIAAAVRYLGGTADLSAGEPRILRVTLLGESGAWEHDGRSEHFPALGGYLEILVRLGYLPNLTSEVVRGDVQYTASVRLPMGDGSALSYVVSPKMTIAFGALVAWVRGSQRLGEIEERR